MGRKLTQILFAGKQQKARIKIIPAFVEGSYKPNAKGT